MKWRRDFNVDHIATTPQLPVENFYSILKYYPHYLHGYAKDGCAVLYEVLGKADPKQLRKSGVTMDELVWHFVLRNEFALNVYQDPLQKQQQQQQDSVTKMMTVIDVEGISVSSVTSEVISFIKRSSDIVDNFYPQRVVRLVIVNSPRWFSSIWTVIARVLPEAVQKKIDILYDSAGLNKYIEMDQIPSNYGGAGVPLGQAEGHKAFVKLAEDWNKQVLLSLQQHSVCH